MPFVPAKMGTARMDKTNSALESTFITVSCRNSQFVRLFCGKDGDRAPAVNTLITIDGNHFVELDG